MRSSKITFLSFIFLFSSFAVQAKKVSLVKDSKIGFEIIKFKIGAPVTGKFNKFTGSADYNVEAQQLSNIKAEIDVESIDTDEEKRDTHLKSPDFFDAQGHPKITFIADGTYGIKNTFSVMGKMTMRGVTKDVLLTFTKVKANENQLHLKAEGTINRLDFGVSWNRALEKSKWKRMFGVLAKTILDDKVKLQLEFKAK